MFPLFSIFFCHIQLFVFYFSFPLFLHPFFFLLSFSSNFFVISHLHHLLIGLLCRIQSLSPGPCSLSLKYLAQICSTTHHSDYPTTLVQGLKHYSRYSGSFLTGPPASAPTVLQLHSSPSDPLEFQSAYKTLLISTPSGSPFHSEPN